MFTTTQCARKAARTSSSSTSILLTGILIAASIASSGIVTPCALAQTTYTVVSLGTATSGTAVFYARRVNSSGFVGGDGTISAPPYTQNYAGLLWNPSTSVTNEFSDITNGSPGAFQSKNIGYGLNNNNVICGSYLSSSNTVPEKAFAWVPSGSNMDGSFYGTYSALPNFTVNFGAINYTGVNNRAYDVSDSSFVVGMCSYPTYTPQNTIEQVIITHAYVFDLNNQSAGLFDLGVSSYGSSSGAKGINSKGEIVVEAGDHIFLTSKTSSSLLYDLGTFSGQYNIAAGISAGNTANSNTTQIAGWNSDPTTGAHNSFVWTQTSGGTGTTTWIPAVAGYSFVEAHGINNYGAVVGAVYNVNPTTGLKTGFAFVWDPTNGMQTLPTINEADSINDSGSIVGITYPTSSTLTASYLLNP